MKKILLTIILACAALFSCTKSEEEISNGLNYNKLIVGKWDVDGSFFLKFNSDNTLLQTYYNEITQYEETYSGSWNIFGRHIDIVFDNYYSGIGGGYTGTIREITNESFEMVVTDTKYGGSNQWNAHRID